MSLVYKEERILYKTKVNTSPNKKQKIYYSYNPENFEKFFNKLSNKILLKYDVAICYRNPNYIVENINEYYLDLDEMNLIVFPITKSMLDDNNFSIKVDYKYAIKKNIPILPIILEKGLVEKYNEIFKDIQFLDLTNRDTTVLDFDIKFYQYLDSVLLGDKLINKIKKEFDGYIFLSYRKMDRKNAQNLMKLIHSNKDFIDIAIWYDEYLPIGDNFTDEIKKAIKKSELFTMVVTPNILEDNNYIITDEYPEARKQNKTIIPFEVNTTNIEELKIKYPGIPTLINGNNSLEINNKLNEYLSDIISFNKKNSPKHQYLIGMAYLNGIDTEINYENALNLIKKAAEKGLIDAITKLISMYHNGDGVERNYIEEIKWRETLVTLRYKLYNKVKNEINKENYLWELIYLGDAYKNIGKVDKAKEQYEKTLEFVLTKCNSPKDISICCDRLGDIEELLYNFDKSKEYYEKLYNLSLEAYNKKNNAESLEDLILAECKVGDTFLSLNSYNKAHEYYLNSYKKAKNLVKLNNNIPSIELLAYCSMKIGEAEFSLENLKICKKYYKISLTLRKKLYNELKDDDSKMFLALMYSRYGSVLLELGNSYLNNVKKCFDQALILFNELNKKLNSLESKNNLSNAYEHLGDYYSKLKNRKNLVLENYNKSLEILFSILNSGVSMLSLKRDIALSFDKKGDVLKEIGKTKEALELYKESLKIRENILNSNNSFLLLRDLSISYEKLGDIEFEIKENEENIEKARYYYNKCMEIRLELNNEVKSRETKRDLSIIYERLGDLEIDQKNDETARDYYIKSHNIRIHLFKEIDTLDIKDTLKTIYEKLGTVELFLGQKYKNNGDNFNADIKFTIAEEYYNKYLEILYLINNNNDYINFTEELIIGYGNLADLYQSKEKFDLSIKYYQKCYSIIINLIRDNKEILTYELLGNLYFKFSNLYYRIGEEDNYKQMLKKSYYVYKFLNNKFPDIGDFKEIFEYTSYLLFGY